MPSSAPVACTASVTRRRLRGAVTRTPRMGRPRRTICSMSRTSTPAPEGCEHRRGHARSVPAGQGDEQGLGLGAVMAPRGYRERRSGSAAVRSRSRGLGVPRGCDRRADEAGTPPQGRAVSRPEGRSVVLLSAPARETRTTRGPGRRRRAGFPDRRPGWLVTAEDFGTHVVARASPGRRTRRAGRLPRGPADHHGCVTGPQLVLRDRRDPLRGPATAEVSRRPHLGRAGGGQAARPARSSRTGVARRRSTRWRRSRRRRPPRASCHDARGPAAPGGEVDAPRGMPSGAVRGSRCRRVHQPVGDLRAPPCDVEVGRGRPRRPAGRHAARGVSADGPVLAGAVR